MEKPGEHWDAVYSSRSLEGVSWYEEQPATSLRLLTEGVAPDAAVIDVGAGASFLVDALLERGFSDVTVLDVSAQGLDVVRARLRHTTAASFVVADLLSWQPERTYGGWHDRAVFHFLTTEADQQRYVETAARALSPGGRLVLGTFAEDGPTSCSGLPTARHSAADLAALFGEHFELRHAEREEHITPAGVVQPFTWVVLERR